MKIRRIGAALLLSAAVPSIAWAQSPSSAESPVATPAVSEPLRNASAGSADLRFVLDASADQMGQRRRIESLGGLAATGALIGVGFAAHDTHPRTATGLWIASGVVGVASVLNWFVLSDLEKLRAESGARSDQEIYAEWKRIAENARLERRIGAVLGGLIGAAGVVGGIVVLNGAGDSLSRDSRKILGTALVAGGAISITDGVIHWVLPRPEERDFSLVERAPTRISVSFGAIPNGASLQLAGAF